jgi:hypothetical protein
MKYLIWFLILVILLLGLMGCARTGEKREYNPWITVLRVSTGNFK